jgi:gamma-glutamyltranspeptidase/glutathione hydrolase
LTGAEHIADLRRTIRTDRATPSAALGDVAPVVQGPDTTHFSVLDREGNRVAATLSINYPFGACLTPPGTGVLLNDEMDDFSMKPGVPNAYGLVGAQANAVAPGKRPLSSMTPTFVEDAGGVAILGTPGGSRIITMVLLAVLDMAAGNLPQSWVSRPRFHHQYLPDAVQYEPDAFDQAVIEGLVARGHRLVALEAPYGNMQAIYWDKKDHRVYAASDPRGGGAAQVGASSD